MNSQTQDAYADEMDPIQTGSQPTGQPYTTTETTTTTHTSRTPHHSTSSTTAGPMGTSGGVVGGEKKGLGHTIKDMGTTLVGTADAMRGSFNESVDKMAGDTRGYEKDHATTEKGLAEISERSFHPSNTTAPNTSGMTGQGSMTGTGGLTGTGAGGVVGHEEHVSAGSSVDPRNAAMHDASVGRQI